MTKISVASAFHKLIAGLAPPAAAFVSWIHFVGVALVVTKPAGISIVDCRKLLGLLCGLGAALQSWHACLLYAVCRLKFPDACLQAGCML